ncbi:TadE family type IV pilus minor pilin [Pseudonocardia endophytica]|uniref:TadE-like protein n=1 Tax=Pseudonocardia endophytica TaxID=401976 RepID=A0A4R1I0Q5_PSEEN|nr:TadE family type IV pilus minor pilin [Pseudonocardia endophytica]TCK27105.1 hypothetical protein EV378_2962 [Pseudonocardia endophytica]
MTVEAAIAVGTLVLVAAAVIAAVASVLASIRCVDAARELARAAARGDTDVGRAAAARIAPSGARMDVRIDGDEVVVLVAADPVGLIPIEVTGRATGLMEPGVVRAVTPPVPDSPPDDAPGGAVPEEADPGTPSTSAGPGTPGSPATTVPETGP